MFQIQVLVPLFEEYCRVHKNNKIESIRVDEINESNQDNLFCCSQCLKEDPSYSIENYQLAKQVIKSYENPILPQYPPLNDPSIIQYINSTQKSQKEIETLKQDIIKYFTELKTDVIKSIDEIQNNMMESVKKIQEQSDKILNEYQSISQIDRLRSILLDFKTDIVQKEKQYREFIGNIINYKQVIQEELIISLKDNLQNEMNLKSIQEQKKTILNDIKNINLFNETSVPTHILKHFQEIKNKIDIELFTTQYQNCQDYQDIKKNEKNEIEVSQSKYYQYILNTVSNIILNKNTSYVFRFQISDMKEGQQFYLGLMRDSNSNSRQGLNDNLSIHLKYKNFEWLMGDKKFGIEKVKKGDIFKLSKENMIEMRVDINNNILEMWDFPNYSCCVALKDEYISNFISFSDLKLYIGIASLNFKITLKTALMKN